MFNENLFKGKVKSYGMTLDEMAKALGINPATLSRKLHGVTDFSRKEVELTRRLLNLEDSEVISIFFA